MLPQIYEVSTPEEARSISEIGVDHVGILIASSRGNSPLPIRCRRRLSARFGLQGSIRKPEPIETVPIGRISTVFGGSMKRLRLKRSRDPVNPRPDQGTYGVTPSISG
jgi:hypothetical protein